MKHDFAALYEALFAAKVRDTGAPPDDLTCWDERYVDAIELAVETGAFEPFVSVGVDPQHVYLGEARRLRLDLEGAQ